MTTMLKVNTENSSAVKEGKETFSRKGSEWNRVLLDEVLAELGEIVQRHRTTLNEQKVQRTEAAMQMASSAGGAIENLAITTAVTTGASVVGNGAGVMANLGGARAVYKAETGLEKQQMDAYQTHYQNALNPGHAVAVPAVQGGQAPAAFANALNPTQAEIDNAKVEFENKQRVYSENRERVQHSWSTQNIHQNVEIFSKLAETEGSVVRGPQESARETLHQGTQVLNALDSQLEQAKGSLDSFIREIYQAGSRYRDIGGLRRG